MGDQWLVVGSPLEQPVRQVSADMPPPCELQSESESVVMEAVLDLILQCGSLSGLGVLLREDTSAQKVIITPRTSRTSSPSSPCQSPCPIAGSSPSLSPPRTPRRPRLSYGSAARAAVERPRILTKVAEELIRRLDGDHHEGVDMHQVKACLHAARQRLELPRWTDEELYVAMTMHDTSGCNRLDRDALATFLFDLLASTPPSAATGPVPSSLQLAQLEDAPMLAFEPVPPNSPVDPFRLLLRAISGRSCTATLPSCGTTEELRLAILRSSLGVGGAQYLFAINGRLLQDRVPLREQGVYDGDEVDLIRVTPPPLLVRLECLGRGCGPSIRGSCGTFRCAPASRIKNGRPIYVRDPDLSRWNASMLYHGAGSRYLLYETRTEAGGTAGRWALTDEQDWDGYSDRSYAYIECDAPHPAYLEGRLWHVYRDVKYQQSQVWVEHDSLRLSVEHQG